MKRFSRWFFTRKWVQKLLRPLLQKLILDYSYWRGGEWDDMANAWTKEPTCYSRELFSFRGWTVELHAIYSPDFKNMFHDHPYDAYRFILSGGYTEEVIPKSSAYIVKSDGNRIYTCDLIQRNLFEGDYELITSDYIHRIDSLVAP